jgi:hypothetical protein
MPTLCLGARPAPEPGTEPQVYIIFLANPVPSSQVYIISCPERESERGQTHALTLGALPGCWLSWISL